MHKEKLGQNVYRKNGLLNTETDLTERFRWK
jgi:hypothetical protein